MIREIKTIIIGNKLRKFLNTCRVINDYDDDKIGVLMFGSRMIISFWRKERNSIIINRNTLIECIGLEISDEIILDVVKNIFNKNNKYNIKLT